MTGKPPRQVSIDKLLKTTYGTTFAMNNIYRTIKPEEFVLRKHYFGVAAVFKNENHILKEWIDHYLAHGAERIYLINHNSNDEYQQTLEPYLNLPKKISGDSSGSQKAKPQVVLYQFSPKKSFKSQKDAYRLYLQRAIRECRWLAIVDMDEFIYSPLDKSIPNILKKYEEYPAIGVNWLCFGSNGRTKQPKSVVKGFTKRAPAQMMEDNAHIKSIVQTPHLRDFGIHEHKLYNNVKAVNTNGQKIEKCFNTPILDDVLVCNHYIIQSWEWYQKKKMRQKHSFHFKNKYTVDYFKNHDVNEVEDKRLWLQDMEMKSDRHSPYS